MKKIVGTTTTRYIGKVYECDNAACSRFIFAGNQRIATVAASGTIYYYHTDHLGSTSVVTDSTGAQVEAITYNPYGAVRTNVPGTPVDVPYKYTSKELDSSTGLYFYEARYYDPVLARFISADTLVSNPRNPQDLNRYSYVNNNPLRYTDPTGHFIKIKFNKFFKRIGGPATTALGIFIAPLCPICGAAVLTQSHSGRQILSAGIVATSVVLTVACLGCDGGTLTGLAITGLYTGAAIGSINGAYTAAVTGQDLLRSVATGAAMGAA